MKTLDAVQHYGSRKLLAQALGISRQAVEQWGPVVAQGQAYKLQSITQYAIRVDPALYAPRGKAK